MGEPLGIRGKDLYEITEMVYVCNVQHGWFDEERDFGMDIALLHSEVSEMLEAYREFGFASKTRSDGKPLDVASEMADVLIRLVDTAKRYQIDLETEFDRKFTYNQSRPYRHGNKKA